MTTDTASDPRWWEQPFRLFQTNIREIDAAMDVEALTDFISESGFNVWLLNAGGIAYFYPVDASYQQPAPSLADRPGGDLIKDALAAASSRGVSLVSRFDFSRLPSDIVRQHPDWAYRRPDGDWQEDDGLISLCPTSDYHLEIVPTILGDFVQRYEVSGVFFNWLNFPEVAYTGEYGGPCHCVRCIRRFAEATAGAPHPAGPSDPGYDDWVSLSRQHIQTLAEEYRRVVTGIRPDAAVFLADAHLDLEFLEINSFLGAYDSGKWWAHTPSEMVSVQRNRDPHARAIVHASANLGLAYRMTDEEPTQFRRYFAQALARGGEPGAVVIGPPDLEAMPSLTSVADILQVHRDNDQLYRQMTPSAAVGIARPAAGMALAAMQSKASFDGYRGVFTALQERQIAFDVVAVDTITAALLERFTVFIVPDGVHVDPSSGDLAAWVANGGRLIHAGADQAAVQTLHTVDLAGRYVTTGAGVRWPAIGSYHQVFTPPSAEAGLWLTTRAPFGPPEKAYGWELMRSWPGLLRENRGAGQVVTFPWTLGETILRTGLTSLGDLLADEVLRLHPAPPVRASFPRLVELTVAPTGDDILVHLIDHSVGRPDRARGPAGSTGVVHFTRPPRQIRSLRGSKLSRRDRADGGADITVELPDLWEAIHVSF